MKREVKILETEGSCKNSLFEKMAKKGDIIADKVEDILNRKFKLTGYGVIEVTTDEKTFKIMYYAHEEGFIYSGSEYLLESIKDYINEGVYLIFKQIKTKKGKTYKVVPCMTQNQNHEEELEENNTDEDLLF